MKKNSLVILLALSNICFSQNRQIRFEKGNLATAFEKAKKEKKLIFVDAFTVWCGPCKHMSKTIFTNDTVADYYNATFVNMKLDMEKGEGIEFAKKYDVRCYPSLLYLDGEGNLVHRVAGSMPAKEFVSIGKNSLIPEKTFSYRRNNFEKTTLNESTILDYVYLISGSCLDPSAKIFDYIKSVKDEDLLKRTNWLLMRDFIYDYQSREMKYFLANIPAFENAFGKDTIADKIAQLGTSYFSKYTRANDYYKTGYENAKSEFVKLNWPNTQKILFEADLMIYERFDKPKFYESVAADYLKYNNNNPNSLNNIAWDFYEHVTDKTQLQAAINMSKRACELDNSYMNLDTYAAVLYKSGNYKDAEIAANEAIEKAKSENLTEADYKETIALLNKIKSKN